MAIPSTRVVIVPASHVADVGRWAKSLAEELGLPLVPPGSRDSEDGDLLLRVGADELALVDPRARCCKPLVVDFLKGRAAFRRRGGGSRKQLIARAVGIHGSAPRVLDATAGLGGDCFHLACLGCSVLAVERSPIVGALLRDGLCRAAQSGVAEVCEAASRIELHIADARDVMRSLSPMAMPDVVYMDPMYAVSTKSALVKKEMRLCRKLVGDDDDATELLTLARECARQRVVVKRHRHAEPLSQGVVATYRGRTVRYDMYHPHSFT